MNQTQRLHRMTSAYDQVGEVRVVRDSKNAWLKRPRRTLEPIDEKVTVGCLSHIPREVVGVGATLNARRRVDFYSRWHGQKEPLLQIWKAP
ncbi:hypothetical protein F0A16_17725 [Salinicola corii]|uniref:Uncharacterized protein n=1 Tax=Salinicola corii TaxID=2606937 RepID=A0A640WAF5_9GAMM|nr:hypothetical protein [Salinicola corii]KAA0016276.1 hypothetical protein F0A16_17725 [Salinicola corii]